MKLLGYRQFVDRIGSIYFSQIKYFYNTRSRKNREKDRERERGGGKGGYHQFSPSEFRHSLSFGAQSYQENETLENCGSKT